MAFYTKTTWVNGSAPAINATNLNKMEQGIEDAGLGVIESSSNTNGSYIKFGDGTLICRHSKTDFGNVSSVMGALFLSAQMSWTFPVAFYAEPNVVVNFKGDSILWIGDSISTTTTATYYAISATSRTGINIVQSLVSIGRWKA